MAANAGRGIAAATDKPIVGVHHMVSPTDFVITDLLIPSLFFQQAHALTPLLTEPNPPEFPFLTLLVSGGHTLLVLTYSPTSFKILATTQDAAIG